VGTTGVVGGRWRATVTAWGSVVPHDRSEPVDWYVAADDRWHIPKDERAVRHVRIDGTAVFETRLRVPGGDAVQRVYSIADGGGLTIVEVRNDSRLPIAVAFSGGPLLSGRPGTAIDASDGAPVASTSFPVGHQSAVRVAIPHHGAVALPSSFASAEQVARGWVAQVQRAGRLHLPEPALVEAVVAARCELLLRGPDATDDPVAVLFAIDELVRLGQPAADWVVLIAETLERVARARVPISGAALVAAARVLHAAGEHRALADLSRMQLQTVPAAFIDAIPDDPALVAHAVEGRLIASSDTTGQAPIAVMPFGFPLGWRGIDFEAHGLAIGVASRLSFAVRWHGARPALLWDVSGEPVALQHRDWSTAQLSGEALLPAPD
jgi:hypothetical protein